MEKLKYVKIMIILFAVLTHSFGWKLPDNDDFDDNGVRRLRDLMQDKKSHTKRMGPAAAAAVQAGASAVQAGQTMATSLHKMLTSSGYSVACAFEIDNMTKWPMTSPAAYAKHGYVRNPPVHVRPGYKEAMFARKTGWVPRGTWGVASWYINGTGVNVMWSAPYNHNHHSNMLAVGIDDVYKKYNRDQLKELTEKMYYKKQEDFVRGEYYYSTRSISYCDKQICIMGTMGTTHLAEVKIYVYPKQYDDLAEKIKESVPRENYHLNQT